MRQMRKKLRRIGRDLSILRYYITDRVPHEQQKEFKRQLQLAFDAGRAFSEIQNIPTQTPVDDEGILKIGPELKTHILETRQIYSEVDQLREIVSDIFHDQSFAKLKQLIHDQEEKASGTRTAKIEI